MTHILVVDRVPRDLNRHILQKDGEALGAGYANTLRSLSADASTCILAPYDGDTVTDFSAFDVVAFTNSSLGWNTDDKRVEPVAAV